MQEPDKHISRMEVVSVHLNKLRAQTGHRIKYDEIIHQKKELILPKVRPFLKLGIYDGSEAYKNCSTKKSNVKKVVMSHRISPTQ